MKNNYCHFKILLISGILLHLLITPINTICKGNIVDVANTGVVVGKVTNAVNNQPIPGAIVSIGQLQSVTDTQGLYRIEGVPEGTVRLSLSANITSGPAPLQTQFSGSLTEGYHTISVSASNYETFTSSGLVVNAGAETVYDLSLSPLLTDADLRFVLNWGSTPRDLDSHMKTPSGAHIYYGSRGSATSEPYVLLDYDVTSGFGPETITMYRLSQGVYHYYVYNYSGTPAITTSQAVVQIYNRQGTVATLEIPQTGEGRYWYVATIDGNSGRVNIVNRIQTTAPGASTSDIMDQKPESGKTADTEGWSFLWDFGDGTTSTLVNPAHTYQNVGLYTVKLTATKNATIIEAIEDSYILVAGSGRGIVRGKVTDATNNQAIAGAIVSLSGQQTTTDAQGNYRFEDVTEASVQVSFTADTTIVMTHVHANFTTTFRAGYHTIAVQAEGYSAFTYPSLIVVPDVETIHDMAISPILTDAYMRFVLNWGASPRDLDSHMRTPSGAHIYYGTRGSATSEPYVLLDYDVTSGYGPETITVYQASPGTYHYYIYNYSGSPSITTSQAVVQIYNRLGNVTTLEVPLSGDGRYWYVATMDGATGRIQIINRIQTAQPGTSTSETSSAKDESDEILSGWSYTWDFGDGTYAYERNPSHSYQEPGVYDVHLSAQNGDIFVEYSRQNYIEVIHNTSIETDGVMKFELLGNYPNPFNPTSTIQFEIPESDKVIVTVYNSVGQNITTVINEFMTSGQHSIHVDAGNWSSGVYLFMIQYKDQRIIGKMTLLK